MVPPISPINQAANQAYFQELLRKHQDSLVMNQMAGPLQAGGTSMGQPHNATASPIAGTDVAGPTRQPPITTPPASSWRHGGMGLGFQGARRSPFFAQMMERLQAMGYRM